MAKNGGIKMTYKAKFEVKNQQGFTGVAIYVENDFTVVTQEVDTKENRKRAVRLAEMLNKAIITGRAEMLLNLAKYERFKHIEEKEWENTIKEIGYTVEDIDVSAIEFDK